MNNEMLYQNHSLLGIYANLESELSLIVSFTFCMKTVKSNSEINKIARSNKNFLIILMYAKCIASVKKTN